MVAVVGFVAIIVVWEVICQVSGISDRLLPSPLQVFLSYSDMLKNDRLIPNALYSIQLNMIGYIEALAICLPLGFFIGLFPGPKAAFSKYIEAMRFLPLAAATGLFIAWFGIETGMKIQFLAASIFVYLLPVVIQRVEDVDIVLDQTAYTLGANPWQRITKVFIPAVCSKIIDDVRVLVAISWTYITIAEALNMSDGGIGALAYQCARRSRIDKVFAILVLIVIIGYGQDLLFKGLDQLLFPHKYRSSK